MKRIAASLFLVALGFTMDLAFLSPLQARAQGTRQGGRVYDSNGNNTGCDCNQSSSNPCSCG